MCYTKPGHSSTVPAFQDDRPNPRTIALQHLRDKSLLALTSCLILADCCGQRRQTEGHTGKLVTPSEERQPVRHPTLPDFANKRPANNISFGAPHRAILATVRIKSSYSNEIREPDRYYHGHCDAEWRLCQVYVCYTNFRSSKKTSTTC